jgi:hypothetical protein
VQTFIGAAERFTLDRQQGQPSHLVFAVEAAGMVPLVEEIAAPYGITTISSGGFDSTTAKHALAQTLAELPTAAEVLHIGDHDASGVHVFSSIAEDVQAFVAGLGGCTPQFTRLAVTPEQIRAVALPTAPPKQTDRRSFQGNETTQVEAIPPDLLVSIIRDAITSRLDQSAHALSRHSPTLPCHVSWSKNRSQLEQRLLMFPCLTRPSQQPLALLRGLKRRRHRNRGLQRHTVAAAWRCCVD